MTLLNEIIIEVKNQIGIIKLNRADRLNALSFNMINIIKSQLSAWKENPLIQMVYIYSASHKAFCAGGDVKKLYHHVINDDINFVSSYLSNQYVMDYMIHTYPKPIVTFVNGYVLGGGVGVSIGSTFFIASKKAQLAMPETQIGFFPDIGASYFLNKFSNQIGRYIGLLGRLIDYKDLLYLGIADYVITEANWEKVLDQLYKITWEKDNVKKQLTSLFESYKTIDLELSELEKNKKKINHIFSHDSIKDMVDSINENDLWENEIKNNLEALSPTALNITLELLMRGRTLSLFDCLKMEHDLSLEVVKTHDFKEGVRSLLIDKDKTFIWNPKSYLDIDKNDILYLFNQSQSSDEHPMDLLIEVLGL